MNKIFYLFLGIIFINQMNAQKLKTANYSEVINQEFTGELAYETTAFVEQYWRVVGNEGFDKSVYFIADHLEKAGFVLEENATENSKLTYRIEKRSLKQPTWEPVDASVKIVGEDEPLLQYSTNRNMIALNSYSTPKGGIDGEVIYVEDVKNLKNLDVKGKIVFAEASPWIFNAAVVQGGALGIMTYNNPDYLQPEKNTTSIQFRSIQLKPEQKSWAIALSYAAKERLKTQLSKGKVNLHVEVETKIYDSEELTIVADIKGSELPKERLVFSAHIQEPGANDNATGVGVALEMASLVAKFIQEGTWSPKRTLTFLWGDEIVSTGRYVKEDKERAKDIKWGISLDMVGENTELTGGSFLIEKMPDPSAVWTRGNDKHSEWGGSPMTLSQMKPHYLNDFVIQHFQNQRKLTNWEVNTNPYEGGSDHSPFLQTGIPSVLFWHFTDQFYHTDNDRLDKVSKTTLKNVGVAALVSAFTLLNSDEKTAKEIIKYTEDAGVARLNEELFQSKMAIQNGETKETQIKIIEAWEDWYLKAIASASDMVSDKELLKKFIEKSQEVIRTAAKKSVEDLKE